MPVVVRSQIVRVHAASVTVGLVSRRDALLAGIPSALTGSLPTASTPSAQLLSDLDCLNELGTLPDGSVPLLIWLTNALALSGQCAEAEVFQQVLDRALVVAERMKNLFGLESPRPPPDYAPGFGVPLSSPKELAACCAELPNPPEEPDLAAQTMNQKQGVVSAFASHIVQLATSTLTAGRARSVSDRLEREPESRRPWVTVYRPSWILPLRQSSIHIYVLLPTAKTRVLRDARAALDTADNPARESHAIPLHRSMKEGDWLAVHVKIPGFEVSDVEPEPWHPPYVRFIVSIRALADVALGSHRPQVTIRSGRGSDELLATLDFDLEVRATNPQAVLRRAALGGGGVALAVALVTATERHALPPIVGLSLSAALLASGASGWMMMRPQMSSPVIRDQMKEIVATPQPATTYVINIKGGTVGSLAVGEHSRAEANSTAPVGTREPRSKDDGC